MCALYSKRAGTSGISGQLYESKLISLLYFRALQDKRIKEFKLASNINNIGAFDDICFTAEVDGFEKPIAVFIQAKHKENKNQILKMDLEIYFKSYLKIRQCFNQSKDMFFKGPYDEVECLFVFYTTAKDEFSNYLKLESKFCTILNDLIGTDGTANRPDTRNKDVKSLCEVAMKEQMTSLAERMAKFINNDVNFQMMLIDDLFQNYHVILAEKVVNVSELQPNGCRLVTFRHDFFDTHDEYLVLFKNTLLKEILKYRKIEPVDIKHFLSDFLNEPSNAFKLSKLIETVITYKNNQLEFNKKSIKDLKLDMKLPDVSPGTVREAVELAAKEILLSPKFKQRVPYSFGNKDITLSGSEPKKKRRINYLASKITDLLVKCKSGKIITIDESLDDGFLQLNGGITGGIGNIFVLDDYNTKLMKITNNTESLGVFAKQLYERLNRKIESHNNDNPENKIPNLCEYKFLFNSNKFPKLLLECSDNEDKVRDFLNKLVSFSSQADEEGVESILKNEIEENQLNEPNYFQAKTDAIFAKFHDEVQKWWIQPDQAPYLTRKSDLFQKARHIIKDQLVSVINFIYKIKINRIDCTFTENAVKSLNLQDQQLKTVITTENTILTVVKVIQHLKNISHIILDLDYIINLLPIDFKKLQDELRNTRKDTALILVCDEIHKDKKKIIKTIAEAVLNKNTIIVTKRVCVEVLQKYFPESFRTSISDETNSLIDMSEESQKNIMESTKVMFQGTELRLDLIIDEKSKTFVKGDILHKIINKEIIVVGTLNVKSNYNNIKHLYVERRLKEAEFKSNPSINYTCDVSCSCRFKKIQDSNNSTEKLEKEAFCSSKYIQTSDQIPEKTYINLLTYDLYDNEQSLSTEVITNIEFWLGDSIDEPKDKVPDETLKKEKNLSSEFFTHFDKKNEVLNIHLEKGSTVSGMFVKTLTSELLDHIVLILAEPGMGKSTLLTNLSIKTKELKPEVWIIRINLLEYSEEFSKWKDDDITIDLLETLNFMCQVILRDKLGKKSKVEIVLEEKNKVVYLKYCTAEDPSIEFELNLFLHFYCEREIIFVFDGFDEICPHYTNVVIKCLKCIANNLRKHRMWIASRSYNEAKAILEKEFGSSYEIDNFSVWEMIHYLYRFWKLNLKLEELNSTQLENVKEFLEYVSAVNTEKIGVVEPLHLVNMIAASYLSKEIRQTHIPLWKYNKRYIVITCDSCFIPLNPLFLYLAALYVLDNIKEEHRKTKEWYLDFETFAIYKRFLEIKIKRRYEEKNEYNLKNPDTIIAYEKEISKSIINHKKLGAFVIFNRYVSLLFNAKDLEEIEENLKVVEKAVEKTLCLVESVCNGIPIFTHMSFTEHFAVEYVCDRLKNTTNTDQKSVVLQFINLIFGRIVYRNIRKIFDHKLKSDNTLLSILEDNHDVIFHWMWNRTLIYMKENSGFFFSFPLFIAVDENLKKCELLFRKTISHALFYTNITDRIGAAHLLNMFNMRNYTPKNFDLIYSKYKAEYRPQDDFLRRFFFY
ncbi:hypothetical protein PYW07_005335 [Mythimna separata]|uniref:NACHT domain-containing protein n=1 Tax=Mythimna separata TaxID=271217 RepID=A0AAD8DPF8_MYTSE|nr:hypothetical protein PYW07_005335 [Mythimna separata]